MRVSLHQIVYQTPSDHPFLAHKAFERAKTASKEAVRISKDAIAKATDEQTERIRGMEKVKKKASSHDTLSYSYHVSRRAQFMLEVQRSLEEIWKLRETTWK